MPNTHSLSLVVRVKEKETMRIKREIKEAAHKRAHGKCERCGKKYSRRNWEAHVHHLTYERLGDERLDDVRVLCLECHGKQHPKHNFKPKCGTVKARSKKPKPKKKEPDYEHMDPGMKGRARLIDRKYDKAQRTRRHNNGDFFPNWIAK